MAPDRTIREQGVESKGVKIGNDVWIGTKSTLVDGLTIGNHAVIGANSVVTQDVDDWKIVAGNPAQVIGDRRAKDHISYGKF
jgi:acetyltransferase-like isoleucine patch superfamily enzyme